MIATNESRLYLEELNKTDEALETFDCIKSCLYINKSIGLSGQEEAITCDCSKNFENGANSACGEDTDCINRLTSVECIDTHCLTCGPDCENQRFQKRQYAQITIFQTEMKGYGVRAEANLYQGQFIYEYIGEVIDEKSFRKKTIAYDQEGIKHFYFMMLQKGEFIDATKKGSLARFCNHSCNPNAYVDKWVVGKKLKMGIFAKRDIVKGEEICFDYNVDRYGANPQKCYCGESNCIGVLGGKTQTDAPNLLPQSLADALSVTSAQEKAWIKSKRSKGVKIDIGVSNMSEEFINTVVPMPLIKDDVRKVMGALMQPNQEPLVVNKLIERIYISDTAEDADIIGKLLIRMHGYQAFSTIIKEIWKLQTQNDTLYKMIIILLRWPAMSKNKITSSLIEDVIKKVSEDAFMYSQNNDTANMTFGEEQIIYRDIYKKANELLHIWDNLQMAFRIRKATDTNGAVRTYHVDRRKIGNDEDEHQNRCEMEVAVSNVKNIPASLPNTKFFSRSYYENDNDFGNSNSNNYGSRYKKYPLEDNETRLRFLQQKIDQENKRKEELKRKELEKQQAKVSEIIEQAKRADEARKRKEKEEEINKAKEREKEEQIDLLKLSKEDDILQKSNHKKMDKNKCFKLWVKCLARYVPNMVAKYEKQIGHEKMKICAKDIVYQIANKEIKRNGIAKMPPKQLEEGKLRKVKDFSRDYMKRWITKYGKRLKNESFTRKNSSSDQAESDGKTKENGSSSPMLPNSLPVSLEKHTIDPRTTKYSSSSGSTPADNSNEPIDNSSEAFATLLNFLEITNNKRTITETEKFNGTIESTSNPNKKTRVT